MSRPSIEEIKTNYNPGDLIKASQLNLIGQSIDYLYGSLTTNFVKQRGGTNITINDIIANEEAPLSLIAKFACWQASNHGIIRGTTTATMTINHTNGTSSIYTTGDLTAASKFANSYGVGIGTWDVISGELTETAHIFTFTSASARNYLVGVESYGTSYKAILQPPNYSNISELLLCKQFIINENVFLEENNNTKRIIFISDAFNNLDTAKAYFVNNEIQLCYSWITPVVKSTDAHPELSLSLHDNLVLTWTGRAVSNHFDIEYLSNMQSYVDSYLNNCVAPLETNPVTNYYTSNSYLMYNTQLYKALDNLTEGDSLTNENSVVIPGGLAQEVATLKNTVLDVDSKLDAPEAEGNTDDVLALDNEGKPHWINPAQPTTQAITEAVAAWLDENPQAPSTAAYRCYPNVTAMKNDNTLTSGMICRTLGYHNANDGGGGTYTVSNTGTANDMNILEVGTNLIASLAYGKIINVKQFGAYGDGIHDDSPVLKYAAELINDNMTLYFPSGIYLHGDGLEGATGTGNSYEGIENDPNPPAPGHGDHYYTGASYLPDIGRDIRLIIANKINVSIIGEVGAEIRSNDDNGECRNNSILYINDCDNVLIKNLIIDGRRQARHLHFDDNAGGDGYSGYNRRSNLTILASNRVIIDNVKSLNSAMDGIYISYIKDDNTHKKPTNIYLSNVDCSGAHRNGLSIVGAEYVYVDKYIATDCGVFGPNNEWKGTSPRSSIDVEAYNANWINNYIFLSNLTLLRAPSGVSMYLSNYSWNVYAEKIVYDGIIHEATVGTSNLNVEKAINIG